MQKYVIGYEDRQGVKNFFVLESDGDGDYKIIAHVPSRNEAEKIVEAFTTTEERRVTWDEIAR